MDNWNAPQWADFNASLMSDIDEYFNTEHKELEPRYTNETPYDSFANSPDSKGSISDASYDTPERNGFAGPTAAGASGASHSRLNVTSEGLASAMSSLRIASAKKALTRRSVTPGTPSVKRAIIDARPTTPVRENGNNIESEEKQTQPAAVVDVCDNKSVDIPSRESAQGVSTSDVIAVEENTDNNATLVESNDDNERSTPIPVEKINELVEDQRPEEPEIKTAEIQKECNEESGKNSDKEISQDRGKSKKKPNDARSKTEIPSDRVRKNIVNGKASKPRVLARQVRRHSISKYRRRSGQYVSLAEAVARFQNGTPKRFRSTTHKDNKAGEAVQRSKPAKMKLTCPVSPALRCKSRARAVTVTNRESEAKQNCNNAKTSRKTDKMPAAQDLEEKTAMPPPKSPVALRATDKVLGEPGCSRDTSAMSISIMSESTRKHTPFKKTVATVVSTDEGIAIRDVEILHFGIPVGNDYKKITRTVPFSFDTRNRELQRKREMLKNQQIEQEKSNKLMFHARPAPSFNAAKKKATTTTTTTSSSVLRPKDDNANRGEPTARTLTFKERNELALKKKKELMDRIVEGEKRARIFRAKPAPTFKPVFVRGNSAENLRAGDGNRKGRGISPASRQKGLSEESVNFANQENKAPIVANQKCPKLKNSLVTQHQKFKKTDK